MVAPATADLMAKMANGHADDLASAVLLATDQRVLLAPAMNPRMWANAATRRNFARLLADGIVTVGPNAGEMAESGEAGFGRMAEPLEIVAAAEALLARPQDKPLAGKRIVITSGPTHEPIDPVRYIANRSSGKQGHAIARAAAAAGADVTLVSGPVTLLDPPGVTTVHVETAREMLRAVEAALPSDIGDIRCRSRRLAHRRGGRAEDEERRQRPAEADAHREPGHPGDDLKTEIEAAGARHRLCGRDRKGDREREGEAQAQRLRLDRRQRRLGRRRRDGRRHATRCISSRRTASIRWPTQSKDDVARTLVARIAAALNGEAK